MGKVVPFKQKAVSPEEEVLRARLKANPDDLALTELFLLKVNEGKFDRENDYAKGILRCVESQQLSAINNFLAVIAPVIESISRHRPSAPQAIIEEIPSKPKEAFKKLFEYFSDENIKKVTKARKEIYGYFFKGDSFLDLIYKLVPNCSKSHDLISTHIAEESSQAHFLVDCLEKIVSMHGLTDEIACILSFCENILHKGTIKASIQKRLQVHSSEKDLLKLIQRRAEKYLACKSKLGKLNFIELSKLLMLQVDLKKKVSNTCNALIEAVTNAEVEEIKRIFNSEVLSGFFQESLVMREESVNYYREPADEEADFMADLFLKLYEENKYDKQTGH